MATGKDLGRHCLEKWIEARWQQTTNLSNIDLLLVPRRPSDIHLSAISQEIPSH